MERVTQTEQGLLEQLAAMERERDEALEQLGAAKAIGENFRDEFLKAEARVAEARRLALGEAMEAAGDEALALRGAALNTLPDLRGPLEEQARGAVWARNRIRSLWLAAPVVPAPQPRPVIGAECAVDTSSQRLRCAKESDHAGECDFQPDRHVVGNGTCVNCGEVTAIWCQACHNAIESLASKAEADRAARPDSGQLRTLLEEGAGIAEKWAPQMGAWARRARAALNRGDGGGGGGT